VLRELSLFLGISLAVMAAASMTLGNLAAYTQKNLKRLLAYSTIAHAGYMLMAVAAMLVFANATARASWTAAQINLETIRAVEGLMYYLAVYLFMNLTAFAVVAMIRNETYSEDIDSYNGLVHQGPWTKVLCICLAVAFFSLVGLPPFGGFFAKLLIFLAAFKAGYVHWSMWALLAVAGANTVFSLFYYVRVLKAMFISPEPEDSVPVQTPNLVGWYLVLITVPILLLGASPLQNDLSRTAEDVARALLR
jgi:NADH-quinone oxidoreductase subunit N